MDIFQGLSAQQIGIIRHTRSYLTFYPGELIFAEGEVAQCMYVIMTGVVDIFRETPDGPVQIARLGRGETFGEMGILISGGRTASARAVEQTTLLEVPRDVVAILMNTIPAKYGLVFMQNLICLLAGRLNAQNARSEPLPPSLVLKFEELMEQDLETALAVLERNLPRGIGSLFSGKKKLAAGEALCHEGDAPNGFYYISQGSLEVLKSDGPERNKWLSRIVAPSVTGEIGYFSNQPRSASILATEDVVYSHFSGERFEKIMKSEPEEAMKILFAAAQMIVYLMLKN